MDIDGDGIPSNSGGTPTPTAYSYSWTNVDSSTQRNIPFTGEEKITLDRPRVELSVSDLYYQFVSNDLLQYMVDSTNENAREYLASHQVKGSSIFSKWRDTNVEEIYRITNLDGLGS